MADFTVAICTYNGEALLPNLLDKLRLQSQTDHFTWDIVVIDNNSTDHTADVIRRYQSDWPATIPLRYYFEPRQGLAFARRHAIRVTPSPLIGFLDDDTLPATDWVSSAYEFGQQHPKAGAYGGQNHGDYEIAPPANFERIACCLAIIERGHQAFQYHPQRGVLPAGAGLVVRTQVWRDFVSNQPVLAGVCAKSLSTKGEDVETLSYIRHAGWQIWYNPAMHLYHHIPKERLDAGYLLNLFRQVGFSRYPLRMLHLSGWQRTVMLFAYVANDFRKFAVHWLKHHKTLKYDQVAACEMELLMSSLISPLYHWKQQFGAYRLLALMPWKVNWGSDGLASIPMSSVGAGGDRSS
ncbi:MAG: glycosyltransferase [Cyanothece sp. SIO1E1]|nr:glycosyltransferase [Cyanothece sp. SIO1E1]